MKRIKPWWITLAVLIVANAWLLWPRSPSGTVIPYSAFVAQVHAGTVSTVYIDGDTITGTLNKSVSLSDLGVDPTMRSRGSQSGITSRFETVFPSAVGDPELMALLESQGVRVEVAKPASPWLGLLLINLVPLGFLVYSLLRPSGTASIKGQDKVMNFARSTARRQTSASPKVTFDDVAGADEAKRDLQEVADFLRFPRKYHDMGARIPRGVLLVGPPGTGKTLMARAVSGEAGVPFFNINATEFVEIFVGVGASRVRDLFEQAKRAAPSIIFIDELDAVGRRREGGFGNISHEREQTLNQLLVEMDGFEDRHEVIVMAATNRPDVLDPALLRPGRFDRQVAVGLPDRLGREAILKVHTQRVPLGPDVDIATLARSTTGFSGADLANIMNEAALLAARRNADAVALSDFEEAIERIVVGLEQRTRMMNEDVKRAVAYHEAGHALVAQLVPRADPVSKISIVPRSRGALGYTLQMPEEDRYLVRKDELLDRIAVMMGGRSAEMIVYGEVSTGASDDINRATELARRMVTEWGMSEAVGWVRYAGQQLQYLGGAIEDNAGLSPETRELIDSEVKRIVTEQVERAQSLLTQHRPALELLTEELLRCETVDGSAVAAAIAGVKRDCTKSSQGSQP